jgi:hypothetical protein
MKKKKNENLVHFYDEIIKYKKIFFRQDLKIDDMCE